MMTLNNQEFVWILGTLVQSCLDHLDKLPAPADDSTRSLSSNFGFLGTCPSIPPAPQPKTFSFLFLDIIQIIFNCLGCQDKIAAKVTRKSALDSFRALRSRMEIWAGHRKVLDLVEYWWTWYMSLPLSCATSLISPLIDLSLLMSDVHFP